MCSPPPIAAIRDLLRSLFFKCHAFDWHVRIPCFLIGPDLKKTMFLLLFNPGEPTEVKLSTLSPCRCPWHRRNLAMRARLGAVGPPTESPCNIPRGYCTTFVLLAGCNCSMLLSCLLLLSLLGLLFLVHSPNWITANP